MLFNIYMFFDLLCKKYNCQMHIQDNVTQTIKNIRLYFAPNSPQEDTMYIERGDTIFNNGDLHVYCVHKNNYFTVESCNVNEVFNSIIIILEETQIWINNINMIISNNGLLSEVLNEFSEKIPFPLMVLDASQTALAISGNYGKGSLDKSWDRMIETGSLGVEPISKYNSLYKETLYTRDFYYIPINPFPYPSYNHNIYIDDEFMGFLSLILTHEGLSEGVKGWYFIAWKCVTNWITLHISQNDLLVNKSVFEEIINGDNTHIDYFEGILSPHGWKKNCRKCLIVLGCVSNLLNMNAHIIKLLNKNDSLYAIEHQGRLVVLCNVDNMTFENHLDFIKPIIHNSGYYGGSSNIFTNLCDTPHFLLQAMLTFQSDSYRIGEISSCQEHIFPYMLHILHTNARMSLIHPALLTLSQYDEEHQSNYCHVLYTYLKNQCNQTETANILSMHRSSLLRKLNKILQITDVDLSDYVTKIHLLISFELNKL